MNHSTTFDPFAGIEDDKDRGAAGARQDLLARAKRGYVPLRKTLVQRPKGSESDGLRPSPRAAVLYDLVHGRQHRALDLLLLLHALEPILDGTPLPLATWAHLMSVKGEVDATAISRALATLERMNLVVREDDSRAPVLRLLREDGSKEAWCRPGAQDEEGPGYFILPHAYWTSGVAEALTLPGKAMLLIILAETQDPKRTAFSMAVDRAQEWYGISERTAERGYRELKNTKLMQTKVQKINDPRHPAGRRDKHWHAMAGVFSTPSRARLQKRATQAARKAGAASTASLVDTAVGVPGAKPGPTDDAVPTADQHETQAPSA